VSIDERVYLRDIERLIRKSIRCQMIEGFEPDPNAKPQPPAGRRGRGAAPQGRRDAAAQPATPKPGQRRDPRRGAQPAAPRATGARPKTTNRGR
jgi:ATP-dependent RNA helicase RhlE